ncbi:MAG: DUF4348 domain-containing protein [Alloprevotella sp.]
MCPIKTLVILLLWVVFCTSCRRATSPLPADLLEEQADSVGMADSLVADSLPEPPRAADGLFDDFVYSFMNNRRFQYERIVFPLRHVVDGKERFISREAWKFNRLYSKEDIYLQVYANARQAKAEKDTALRRVTVDCIDFGRQRVEQYVFAKVQQQWRLTEIDTYALSRHADSGFYAFYNQFATSTDFQMTHIADPFYFKTYDSDSFQTIEGVLDVNQWPDFRPDLPTGKVTSINYGQSYGQSRRRVLMLCSPSGGMSCSLTFLRMGKTWMLEKLEN